jgi:hypothetical protein
VKAGRTANKAVQWTGEAGMRIEEVGQCAGETGQLTEEAGQQAGEAAWTLAGEARKRTKEAEHIE